MKDKFRQFFIKNPEIKAAPFDTINITTTITNKDHYYRLAIDILNNANPSFLRKSKKGLYN